MNDWIIILRYIHVLAASAWLGEVLVINLIIIPFADRAQKQNLEHVLKGMFLQLFRLASALAAVTVTSGVILLYGYSRFNPTMLFTGRWGPAILVGGSMGLLLAFFHFFMEKRLGRRILRNEAADHVQVHARLKIVPRIGLLVITTIYLLMMYAVRGF